MNDTLVRYLSNLVPERTKTWLLTILRPLYDRYSTQSLMSAGLVIKAGGSTLAKSGSSDWYGQAKGVLLKISASTDMPALVGTVTNAKFNVYAFFVDSAGTLTSAMGTEGATLAKITFPAFPENKALIGFLIINPTGAGNFVGGTTALDDAGVTPNAVYVNAIGPMDPTVLIQ